ncbi:MAG: FAD-binding oxidoreductase, partial [Oscillospiraceae bacterium]|nr:FAD-binding oxidoreductase [Oscillospiraceae bacterium]
GAAGVPVTVRGAGTGQVGGSVPVRGGVVLSVKGMNQILALDEENKTITVQPGVLLQDVKAEADKHGLYYPPDPGEPTATIGGNASTNASGPCAVKYGRTRDYVLDAVIVLADGTVTRLSDETAAVIGGEGTLGVITELTLRLIDKPGADAILLFPFLDTETAVNAARAILDAGFDPAVVEYLDTDIVEFSGNVTGNPVFPVEMDGERVGATLMVTIEGDDDDAVMEKMEQIAEMAEDLECLDILVGDSPTMKRDFWAAHAAFHTSMESGAKSAWEVNVDIPMDAAADMIGYAKTVGEENGLKVMLNAHLASGGMHIHAVSDLSREESAPAAAAFAAAVYAKTAALGGNVAGEYGIGYAKNAYLSDEARAAFAAAKTALDPQGILNPGKRV